MEKAKVFIFLLFVAMLFVGCTQAPPENEENKTNATVFVNVNASANTTSQKPGLEVPDAVTQKFEQAKDIYNESGIVALSVCEEDNSTIYQVYSTWYGTEYTYYDENGSFINSSILPHYSSIKEPQLQDCRGLNLSLPNPNITRNLTSPPDNTPQSVIDKFEELADGYKDYLGAALEFCAKGENDPFFLIGGDSPNNSEYVYFDISGKIMRNLTRIREMPFISECELLNESRPKFEVRSLNGSIPDSVATKYSELDELYSRKPIGLAFLSSCTRDGKFFYEIIDLYTAVGRTYIYSKEGELLGMYKGSDLPYYDLPEPIGLDKYKCTEINRTDVE